MYLATWVPLEDWDGVKPSPEDVWKPLEILEPNILTAHREVEGQVAWIFLVVLWQASLEVQDQTQR